MARHCTHGQYFYSPSARKNTSALLVQYPAIFYSHLCYNICDRILQNPAYGTCAQLAQRAFLVPQVKNCQTSNFVVAMSKNLSSNCCHRLRRLGVSYQGEVSFTYRRLDLPSRCSCRARSPLHWGLIRIRTSGLSRRTLTHVLSLLGIEEEARDEVRDYLRCLLYTSPSPRDATLSRMPSSA